MCGIGVRSFILEGVAVLHVDLNSFVAGFNQFVIWRFHAIHRVCDECPPFQRRKSRWMKPIIFKDV